MIHQLRRTEKPFGTRGLVQRVIEQTQRIKVMPSRDIKVRETSGGIHLQLKRKLSDGSGGSSVPRWG